MRKRSLRTEATPAKRIAGKKRKPGALGATASSIVDSPPAKGTERQHVESAVRESEKLRKREERRWLVFQKSSLPMWMYDVKTLRFLAVNRAATTRYGYTEAEFMEMTIRDIRPQEDLPPLEDALRLLKPGETTRGEWRHRTKKGEIRAVEVASDSIVLGGREARLVVVNDITDRKNAERARDHALALLRATLESSADGILTVGLDRRVESYNQAFVDMWSIPAELLATSESTLMVQYVLDQLASPERFLEQVRRMYDHPSEESFDTLEFKDGRIVERFSRPMMIDGRPQGRVLSFRDVTERRRAADELAESEKRHRDLVAEMNDGIFVVDARGSLTFANPALARLLGFQEPAQALGRNFLDFVAPDMNATISEFFKQAVASGKTRGATAVDIVRADEKSASIEVASSPVTEGDRVVGLRGIIRDITDRRLAEKELNRQRAALTEAHRLLQTIVDTTPARIFWKDRDSRYLGCNPAYAADAGEARREDIVGKDDFQLWPWAAQAEAYRTEDRRMIESGISKLYYEALIPIASGASIWARGSKVPLRDESGAIIGVLGIYEDITERKSAEDELRTAKEFSDALVDNLPGILCLFETTGRLLRWNRLFEAISGFSAEEIAGMTPAELFPAEGGRSIEDFLLKVFDAGAMRTEIELQSRDGKLVPFYFVGARIVDRGSICCLATGIDLTSRKSLEEALRQAQKIEAVGQLAGGVAHDFNNLLGVILGYGELALSEVEQSHPVARHVAEMLKAAKRGAALTRQLQAFGRKQFLQPRLLDLNLLVKEAGKMLGRVIGEDVVLVDRLAPQLGAIRADPNQVDQILLNLAVNARDAMPGGGTLTLETANVELGEERAAARSTVAPGRYVRLAVADTGVGMSEETQRRIFEPFFTTKPVGQGTGMGLATVYGIVKQSDGYIAVESEPGRGTTFEIYFPRVEAMAEAPTPAIPLDVVVQGTETILLVEDNLPLREVTRQRLEESGYAVLQAEDGEAALELAGEYGEAIDLLLTDVVMPRLGGLELARRLASRRPGIRVLYMSGYTDDKILEQGALQEGVALLTKPFTRDQLANAVREALDRPGFGRTGS